MHLKTLLESIHESPDLSTGDELKRAVSLIYRVQSMTSSERDVIRAAFRNGPLHDGDVPSKSGRDSLVQDGFVAKVVVKGEDGFNACTYLGFRAYKLIEAGALSPREVEVLRARLKAIYDATEGYADGAPDATAHDKLCNEISALAHP